MQIRIIMSESKERDRAESPIRTENKYSINKGASKNDAKSLPKIVIDEFGQYVKQSIRNNNKEGKEYSNTDRIFKCFFLLYILLIAYLVISVSLFE